MVWLVMGWCCQWQSLFGKFGILKKHFVCSAVVSLCGLPLMRVMMVMLVVMVMMVMMVVMVVVVSFA